MFGRGFSVTTEKNVATYYGNIIKDFILSPDAKIYKSSTALIKNTDFNIASKLYEQKFKKKLPINKAKKELMYRNDTDATTVFWKSENKEILKAKELWGEYIKSKGYDAVKEADTINILNLDIIKPKSQFIEIWNKVHNL